MRKKIQTYTIFFTNVSETPASEEPIIQGDLSESRQDMEHSNQLFYPLCSHHSCTNELRVSCAQVLDIAKDSPYHVVIPAHYLGSPSHSKFHPWVPSQVLD